MEGKEKRLDEIGKVMAEPTFWETNDVAQKTLKERASLIDSISPWKQEKKELEELKNLIGELSEKIRSISSE